jgi:hypothetical protein
MNTLTFEEPEYGLRRRVPKTLDHGFVIPTAHHDSPVVNVAVHRRFSVKTFAAPNETDQARTDRDHPQGWEYRDSLQSVPVHSAQ